MRFDARAAGGGFSGPKVPFRNGVFDVSVNKIANSVQNGPIRNRVSAEID
jgi:hypothetical protein